MAASDRSDPVLAGLDDLLSDLEDFYKDLHANPELSMQEERTSGKAAERLGAAGFEVTKGVGKTGVVGLLENGEGPTVMLRADMDALPVREDTGLPYASDKTATDGEGNEVPVAHACGHDMHTACLAGATTLLARATDAWSGTLLAVFQPVLRLQTVVSREIAATDAAVLTVGALQAGTKENVIPDQATIKLNVRTFDEDVREKVLDAIKRIVEAEAEASEAPRSPEITPIDRYPLTVNDPDATERVATAFGDHFDRDRVQQLSAPVPASEDFGSFGSEWRAPSVFWYVGGTDPDAYAEARRAGRISQDIPTNHYPHFAPVIHPTLEAGVEAMVVAARAWLSS
jgi:metal-dependent amidase/aminoacylase/carboxypeptidase family protein